MRKKAADRTAEQGQLHPDFHGMFLSRSKPRCPVCDFGMVAGIHTGDWHCGGCRRIIDDKLMVYSRNPDAPGLDKFLEDYKKAKWGLRDAEIKGAVPNVATTKKETQTIGQGYKRRCLDHNNPAKEADAINKLAALGCAKCYTVMTVQGDVAKCLNCGEEKRA
jgi:ribosomal protein S27AE